jgi:hypothetical protein
VLSDCATNAIFSQPKPLDIISFLKNRDRIKVILASLLRRVQNSSAVSRSICQDPRVEAEGHETSLQRLYPQSPTRNAWARIRTMLVRKMPTMTTKTILKKKKLRNRMMKLLPMVDRSKVRLRRPTKRQIPPKRVVVQKDLVGPLPEPPARRPTPLRDEAGVVLPIPANSRRIAMTLVLGKGARGRERTRSSKSR